MKRLCSVSVALVALLGSAFPLYAAVSETLTGTAARTGTYKRPLLIVDGKRYELKASDSADASVAELLGKFSDGDTGRYVIKGRRQHEKLVHRFRCAAVGRFGGGVVRLRE
jgi:hypothetical protein